MDFGDVKAVSKKVRLLLPTRVNDLSLQITRRLCKELNEYFICPMLSDVLTITEDADAIQIDCQDGAKFVFPRVRVNHQ